MSDPEIETSPSEAVTSEAVGRKIGAVTDSLTEQLAHLCELMKELRHGQTQRRHGETAPSRATSISTGRTSRSDPKLLRKQTMKKGQTKPFRVWETLALSKIFRILFD